MCLFPARLNRPLLLRRPQRGRKTHLPALRTSEYPLPVCAVNEGISSKSRLKRLEVDVITPSRVTNSASACAFWSQSFSANGINTD